MTIMFSDVRGFTTISEIYKDDPQGLTQLMNRFLTPLTNAIIDAQGHDRQIHGRRDHGVLERAARRRRARDQCLRRRARHAATASTTLNREREARRARQRHSRSSRSRSASASIPARAWSATWARTCASIIRCWATAVNLASRLEGQSKSYGLPIIIGSRTASVAKDRFATLELDFIAVKGKKEPEVVYALVGREDMIELRPIPALARDKHEDAVALSRPRLEVGAGARSRKAAPPTARAGSTRFIRSMSSAFAHFQITPPPDDWDGAYALETK